MHNAAGPGGGVNVNADSFLAHLRTELERADAGGPLYKRLKSAIAAAILSNALKPGMTLPGERALAETLAISRVTVRTAIGALVEEGLVNRRHGSKTEVRSHVEKSLSTLTSFSDDMAARGLVPGCIWISKTINHPSPAEMMALGLAPKAKVLRLERIRTGDGMPIAVETAAVPAHFLPSPDLVGESLYAALEKHNALPQRAVQRMRARPATRSDAGLLHCDIGAPLLVADRRCFLADGQIVEFTETRYRGDVYDFVTELSR